MLCFMSRLRKVCAEGQERRASLGTKPTIPHQFTNNQKSFTDAKTTRIEVKTLRRKVFVKSSTYHQPTYMCPHANTSSPSHSPVNANTNTTSPSHSPVNTHTYTSSPPHSHTSALVAYGNIKPAAITFVDRKSGLRHIEVAAKPSVCAYGETN